MSPMYKRLLNKYFTFKRSFFSKTNKFDIKITDLCRTESYSYIYLGIGGYDSFLEIQVEPLTQLLFFVSRFED